MARSEELPEDVEVAPVGVVTGGVPAAVSGEVLRRGSAEGLHEGAEPTDQGVHGVDVMAAPLESSAASGRLPAAQRGPFCAPIRGPVWMPIDTK